MFVLKCRNMYSGPYRRLGATNALNVQRHITILSNENMTATINSKGIVVLSMQRKAGRNALSRMMLQQFSEVVDHINTNTVDIRALLIKSDVPKVFCAGADLKERATMTETEVELFVKALRDTFQRIAELPVPTIAAIDGAALGGGLELALACDLRIASSGALLGLPETKLAILPGAGGTQRLPRIVGIARAKELIFTGRRLTAKEAADIGLVTEYTVGDVTAATRAMEMICGIVSSTGPVAVRMAKKAIDEGSQCVNMTDALAVERTCYQHVVGTNDRPEGIKAFIEKRQPVYTGK